MAAISLLLLLLLLTATLVYIIGGNYKVYKLFYDILRRPSQLHHTITDRLKSCGGTVHSTYLVLTSDPKNIDHVFNKRHFNFPKGPEFKDKLDDAFGEGLLAADGESGIAQRRIFHSIFSSPPFEQLLNTSLLEKLETGLFPILESSSTDRAVGTRFVELDMQDVYKRFMFDIMCIIVLGFDPNYLSVELLPDVLYAKAYEAVEEAVFYRHVRPDFWWKFQRWVGIGEERKCRKARENFDEFLYQTIDVKRRSLDKTEGKNSQFDLLTFFMVESREQESGEMSRLGKSDKLMRDMAFNMIAAGSHTVSVNLSWLLWLIVSHPSVEAKILDEIRANLGSNNWRIFSDEEISGMVYLHAAVCEALRLYPSAPFEHRTVVEAETLPSGHFVGKNASILFSMYSMGRMEEIWGQDCMEFKPERWISEGGDKIVHVPSYKFFTFSAGPRACLGKKMAFLYAKQVTSALLYNYKVELVEGHPVTPVKSLVGSEDQDGTKKVCFDCKTSNSRHGVRNLIR
ncbi:Alkane hydroxylase MAH1 [Linum grandiflorum]